METSVADGRLDGLKTVARRAGIKLTHQRLEIFRAIAATDRHPDAETVWRDVRARIPTLSLATVYRTLWLLADVGLVSTVVPSGDRVRFDANLDPHAHYVCIRCGLTRDLAAPDDELRRISGQARRYGTVVATAIEVRGICARCAGAGSGARATGGTLAGPIDTSEGASPVSRSKETPRMDMERRRYERN
jgi:Fur family transcriptional regulator, peroxide stress response regulator